MKQEPGTETTPSQWYNSDKYKVSYKRLYKCASSSIIDLMGKCSQTMEPEYKKRFTVVRDPLERVKSIYKQLKSTTKLKERDIKTFSEFLQYTKDVGLFDKHQFKQVTIIENQKMKLFKLEQLHKVCDYIGANREELKRLNIRKQAIQLTPQDRQTIKELYQEDIELYNNI